MLCTRCETNVDDKAFCTNCGLELRKEGEVLPSGARPEAQAYVEETDNKAMVSLVLGILGLFFSIVTGIPAIIMGRRALSQIKESSGRLSGETLALAGVVLGFISIALAPLLLMIAIPNLTRSRMAANQAAAEATVRTLGFAQTTYSTNYPKAGYAPDLATLGLGGPACASGEGTQKNACLVDDALGCLNGTSGQWCIKDDYRYSIVGLSNGGLTTDYIITATPVNSGSGKTSYCSHSDSVVRYRSGPPLFEPIKTAAECGSWQAM